MRPVNNKKFIYYIPNDFEKRVKSLKSYIIPKKVTENPEKEPFKLEPKDYAKDSPYKPAPVKMICIRCQKREQVKDKCCSECNKK